MRHSRLLVVPFAVAASLSSTVLRAIDLPGVLPAAADQPQINAEFYLGDNTSPQTAVTQDPTTGDNVTVYSTLTYLDTGASGTLLSTPTAQFFSIPDSTYNGTTVNYNNVGVAGTAAFTVSDPVRVSLSNNFYDPNSDPFGINQPDPSTFSAPSAPMRFQVGPNDTSITDPVDQIINELNSIDVIGMPALQGKVMVLDPTPVNNFNALNTWDLNSPPPDVFLRTYIYPPSTPFVPGANTNPGIPNTSLHVKLSYASFDQFTTTTPAGAPGPTLAHNPFIGENPVDLFEGKSTPNVPGIKITRNDGAQTLSSEGNWLLDTGAAASIISQAQASNLGVSYKAGTFGSDTPDLVDSHGNDIPNQFTFPIQGVGGTETLAGFYLDSLLVRTTEGSATDDNNPNNIRFLGAPVLVGDITLTDPTSGKLLTLDGVFGMNFLVASLDPTGLSDGLTIPYVAPNYFDWITFDEPNGLLGLQLPMAGDANRDGHVDLSDLAIVLNNFGKTTSLRTDGNFDGADTIDLYDLNEVLNNFGTANPVISELAATTPQSSTPAPEPASLALLALGTVALITRRRPHKSA